MTETLIPAIDETKADIERLQLRTQLFVDGDFRDAVDGGRFVTENPATGRPITEVAKGGPADGDVAVAAARRAADDGRWSRLNPADRKRILVLPNAWDAITARIFEAAGFPAVATTSAATPKIIVRVLPVCRRIPLTSSHMSRFCGSLISSVVTSQGPIGPKVSQPLPLPHCDALRFIWYSRSETSLIRQ